MIYRFNTFVLIPNDGWGGVNPSASFSEALIANEGMDSYRRKAWILTYDDMIYNMPYDDDADVNTDELKSKDPLRGIKSKNGVFGNAGYWSYMLAPLRSDLIVNNTSTTQQNDIVMRYAEVLLLYAEACVGNDPDGSGLKALQEVQKRAGSAHVSSVLTLDEVKNELMPYPYTERFINPNIVQNPGW